MIFLPHGERVGEPEPFLSFGDELIEPPERPAQTSMEKQTWRSEFHDFA